MVAVNKRKQRKEGTKNVELVQFAETKADYTERDIKERNELIINAFLSFLKENGLNR